MSDVAVFSRVADMDSGCFKVRSDPDPVFKIWSNPYPDPVSISRVKSHSFKSNNNINIIITFYVERKKLMVNFVWSKLGWHELETVPPM